MKVGVVVPSRLAPRPGGRTLTEFGPELWLDGALASVRAQTLYNPCTWEIYVGISPGERAPLHAYDFANVIRADRPGQSAAVNAAADVACLSSDVLLFLEDDDRWHVTKAAVQLPLLDAYPFLSCSQRRVNVPGEPIGSNDYPVPSGWAMRSDVWSRVGGFNASLKWMVDTEWLGRLSEKKIRRAHVVPRRRPDGYSAGLLLSYVARYSEILELGEEMLVDRTDNPEGGMSTISRDFAAGREADDEAAGIRTRFGGNPW
jgi:glycosyltransferase involved in cell wall biosynthesis